MTLPRPNLVMAVTLALLLIAAAGCAGGPDAGARAEAAGERYWFDGRILTGIEYFDAVESGELPDGHGTFFIADGDDALREKYDDVDGIIFRDTVELQSFVDALHGPDAPRLPGPR